MPQVMSQKLLRGFRMGRKRIPDSLKIIQGTFRKDRALDSPEPDPLHEVPKPPSYLSKYGKKIWRELAPDLVEKQILTSVDLYTFEMLCSAYQTFREAQDAIYRPVDPETGKKTRRTLAEYMAGRNSQTCLEYQVMKQSYNSYKAYMAEFGLSAPSRSKIDLKGPMLDEDPIEKMWNSEE